MRSLTALGTALAMGFALVVTATAFAGTGELRTDELPSFPVTLKSTETGAESANQLESFGGFTRCPGTVLTGHQYNVTPHEAIATPATKITVTPDYGACTATLGAITNASTTIDMNGCDFVLGIGETTGGVEGTYGVNGKEVCPEGKHIQVTVFSSAAHSLKLCTLQITAPAEGVVGPHLSGTAGSGDLDISGTFGNFTIDKSGLCGAGEDKEAKLAVDATIKGYDAEGEPTEIALRD